LKRLYAIEAELAKLSRDQEKMWSKVKGLRENQEKLWLEVKFLREGQEKLWEEVKLLREDQRRLRASFEALGRALGIKNFLYSAVMMHACTPQLWCTCLMAIERWSM